MEKSKKVQVVVFRKHEDNLFVLLLLTNEKSGAFWQNITGSVEAEEDFVEGAKRELHEETQIIADVFDTHYEFSFHTRWNKDVVERCFYCFTTHDSIVLSDEHQDYKWANVKELKNESFKFETNFIAFQKALACID